MISSLIHSADHIFVFLQDNRAFHLQSRSEDAVRGAPLVSEELESLDLFGVTEESVNLLNFFSQAVFHLFEVDYRIVGRELDFVLCAPVLQE